jgi:hypothetical protein
MNDGIRNFAEALRGRIDNVGETPETTDLHLTRREFMDRMLLEGDGQILLDLMEDGEWRVCERLGLTNAYLSDGTAYIDVPRWNNLLAHLRIVQSVFSKEPE